MDYNALMQSENLILLHGWGMSPEVFAPLVEQLDSLSPELPPLPGYPHSPWTFEPDFAQQLQRMAAELPAGHLLGWSLGGLYAIELARLAPDKFNRVTLVACNPCFVRRPDWPQAVDATVFDQFCADLVQDRQRTLRRFLALQMQGEAEARRLTREIGDRVLARGTPDQAVLQFGLGLLKEHDARSSLSRLQQPLCLILGDRDLLVPVAAKRQISEVVPAIRVESVAGAAHAPFLSHTAEVVALLNPIC